MSNNRITIDWTPIFNGMMSMMFIFGMSRILSRAITSEKPALLPQTVRKLRFATTAREIDRDKFVEWVETEKIELLQAGGYYRDGSKPTLVVLTDDNKIYAPFRHGDTMRLLSVRWEDLAEETVHQAEKHGLKIAGVSMLAQVKRKEGVPYKATVECPICGDVIEVRDGDISRTEVLKRHIVKKHSGRQGKVTPDLLPQLDTSPDQPKRTYRDIIHDIITKYSRSSKESIDYMFFYNERHNQEQRLRLALVLAKRNNAPEYGVLKRFATKHFPYLLVRMKEDEKMWKEQDEEDEAENEDTEEDLLPQAILIEGGELVPSQYRDLIGWVSEPLPDYSLSVLPAVVPEVGERKIDAVMKQLKDGVGNIQDSYQFRLFLTTMSKFHKYSIGNLILIAMQKPSATHVAGFTTWKDLGRWVSKGERGISILAPVMPPKQKPEEKKEVEAEIEIEPRPVFFKVVYVFDLSQTEGKPLPEFEVPVLTGEANEGLFASLLALMKKRSAEVSFESRPYLDPGIKGQYSPPAKIWVRPEESRAQQLKSLIHEVGHYYSEGVFRIPRGDAETIAESAAFVVGAHFGFDSGVRSFPYVALWAQDKRVLEVNLAAIRRVSTAILEDLEKGDS